MFNVPVHANATIPIVQDIFSASSFLSQVSTFHLSYLKIYDLAPKGLQKKRIGPSVWVDFRQGPPWASLITSTFAFLSCKPPITWNISPQSERKTLPQLYVYILYPMSAVAFFASIYMTLAVTVKVSRTKSKFLHFAAHQNMKRLNGILPSAGRTSTERSAWRWRTRGASWSTSSPSPPSPSPSMCPSSWRSQWPSTMEPTKWMLLRQERTQPSFSGEPSRTRPDN